MSIKSFLRKKLYCYRLEQQRKWAINVELKNIKTLELLDLAPAEYEELCKQWDALQLKVNPLFYKVFKTIEGFNSKYLSDDLFYPLIIRCLNPINYALSFEHKGFYSFLFDKLSQPKNYVKNIRGVLYDSEMHVIKKEEAIAYLIDNVDSFIIKPTKNSCMGKNVRMMKVDKESDLLNLFCEYGNDFVIQEVLQQSQQTAVFNRNSLNTFRVSSLYINGVVTICSVVFRCGQGHSPVDNCGAGGLMVGIDEDGCFREYAYDNKYKRHYSTLDNVVFKGKCIPDVKKIIDIVENYHPKYFPNLGFIGWDFCLDLNDDPILIEVNLEFPGIQLEQLSVGKPIFDERTDEVIDFVNRNREFKM